MDHPSTTPSAAVLLLREQQWRAELNVNWIRAAALVGFYLQHLANIFLFKDPTLTASFHRSVTVACGLWALAIAGIFYALLRRWMPPYLKYGAALWDLTMVGVVLGLGDGPRSSLLILLPLVVGASAMRLSRGLVWFSTLGAMACYLSVLAQYAWVKVGFEKYYATPELRIPRSQELILLIALGVAGLFAGQTVRQAQRLLQPVDVRA